MPRGLLKESKAVTKEDINWMEYTYERNHRINSRSRPKLHRGKSSELNKQPLLQEER